MIGIPFFAALCFALAVVHTFSTKYFEMQSAKYKDKFYSGFLHLLGEIEIVFGFWAMIFIIGHFFARGVQPTIDYVESRVFTEPMFVFVVMIIAGSRPIIYFTNKVVNVLVQLLPIPPSVGLYFLSLFFLPLMGSFVTEPAAMTLAALLLSERYFSNGLSERLKYFTMAVLFVNVSIGGAITAYAAPPVLMVAAKWNWNFAYMVEHFSWRVILGVFLNSACISFWFRKELIEMGLKYQERQKFLVVKQETMHPAIVIMALLFLLGVILSAHHIPLFIGLFLFFLGFTEAFRFYFGKKLILREALLVAFFLAGLVVLGGQQAWWVEPILLSLSENNIFYAAIGLTAFLDNAALTYLASLVPGLSDGFKYAVVAGALTGGGLTIIANAPNPAGVAILKKHFSLETINPFKLLGAALIPTIIAMVCFKIL